MTLSDLERLSEIFNGSIARSPATAELVVEIKRDIGRKRQLFMIKLYSGDYVTFWSVIIALYDLVCRREASEGGGRSRRATVTQWTVTARRAPPGGRINSVHSVSKKRANFGKLYF